MTQEHPKNPLHGITLAMMLEQLVAHVGWAEMGRVIPIRCFTHDPSLKSSLTFLRKTPWARAKVEAFYLDRMDEIGSAASRSEDGGGSV
ncbi:MAG: VF530 family protein [Planctomycetota bacterium]